MLIFLYLFLFTASWTSAFSIGTLSLPLVFAFLYNLSLIFKSDLKIKRSLLKILISPLFLWVFYLLCSSIINYHEKSFKYTIAYFIFPFLYSYIPLLVNFNISERVKLKNAFFFGCLFVSIFSIFEFIIRYYAGIDISSFLPHSKDNLVYALTDKGHILFRSRAFSTEPMITGLFLSTALQYFLLNITNHIEREKKIFFDKYGIKIICVWLVLFGIFSTASASSIFISLLGIILIFFKNIYFIIKSFLNNKNFLKYFLSTLTLILSLAPLIFLYFTYDPIKTSADMFLEKISLNSNYNSVISRTSIAENFYDLFLNDPFGLSGAVGRYSKDGSAINWYLTLLADLGFLGTMITFLPITICCYFGTKLYSNKGLRRYEKFSLICIPIFGLMFHGTFYASPLWPLLLIIPYL